jgi:hypothetical protein
VRKTTTARRLPACSSVSSLLPRTPTSSLPTYRFSSSALGVQVQVQPDGHIHFDERPDVQGSAPRMVWHPV